MDYKALYFTLFNRLSDLQRLIERQDYGAAREMIIALQQETEEMYLSAEEPEA